MEGSNTDSASSMSNWDNAWQRPANPNTSVADMALQTPAKPIGSPGDLMALAVVERPSSGEERKWGRCQHPGAGAMGNELSCRETWRRDRR